MNFRGLKVWLSLFKTKKERKERKKEEKERKKTCLKIKRPLFNRLAFFYVEKERKEDKRWLQCCRAQCEVTASNRADSPSKLFSYAETKQHPVIVPPLLPKVKLLPPLTRSRTVSSSHFLKVSAECEKKKNCLSIRGCAPFNVFW